MISDFFLHNVIIILLVSEVIRITYHILLCYLTTKTMRNVRFWHKADVNLQLSGW